MYVQNIQENCSLNEVKQRRLSVHDITVKVQEELGGCGWGIASGGPVSDDTVALFWSVKYPKGFLSSRERGSTTEVF